MVISKSIIDTIKTAILDAQYKAAKAVTAVQLSLYRSIPVRDFGEQALWSTSVSSYSENYQGFEDSRQRT